MRLGRKPRSLILSLVACLAVGRSGGSRSRTHTYTHAGI